jgi:alpha-glucuronidase
MAYTMREYDCWFQQQTLPPPLPAEMLSRLTARGKGLVFDNAVAEYRLLLKKCWNIEAVEVSGDGAEAGVFIGMADSPDAHPEGFTLQADTGGVRILGGGGAGALYGVYRLFFLLAGHAGGTLDADGVNYTSAPAARVRAVNHWDNLDGTIERGYAGRSLFFNDNRIRYNAERVKDYCRLLASAGINRLSLNNVNVRGAAKLLITDALLPGLAEIAAIARPFGIRLLLAVNFAAPYSIGGLSTADPLDGGVERWWRERADAIYRHIGDLAGFLVKADSEGEPGPFKYGRSHADGANMLARALSPHGGEVIWRCFVYNSTQDWRDTTIDRARAAYDTYTPLDGAFERNVILQIKHGPLDFQVAEPVMPLFGALTKTRCVMEWQITQEYTGQQIDLCFLPWLWERILRFDTGRGGGAIRDMLAGSAGAASSTGGGNLEGLAAVANVGLDDNWTGHTLAQANLYGYGRLAWCPASRAQDIAAEWSRLTFGAEGDAADVARGLLMRSYPAYEKYNAPFGVCFMVTPSTHYGPNIEGYEFSKWGTYHRASRDAIGVDRTAAGTGYAALYAPEAAARFSDPARCPECLLLFFHRLPYDFVMKNGETLLQNIYNTHFEGCEEARAMLERWKTLEGRLDSAVYHSVLNRFTLQLENAREWRDQINTYFYRKTATPDKHGRRIYD